MKTIWGLLVVCLVTGQFWAGCDSEGGSACLQDLPTNASAKLEGQTIELGGTAKMGTGTSPTPHGVIWTEELTLAFDINFIECDHRLTFWIENPELGKATYSGQALEDGSSFTGMYAGEIGAENLVKESSITITAFDSTVSGTFKAVLPDGTTFTKGSFHDIMVK